MTSEGTDTLISAFTSKTGQPVARYSLGLGKNTGTPVYRGISLAWYVPRHTCPYRGILAFLFIVTENLKISKILTDLKLKQLQVESFQLQTIEFNLKMVCLGVLGTR